MNTGFYVFLICLFFHSLSLALPKDVIEDNERAVAALKKQEFRRAQEEMIRAIGKAPFAPELQVNLGLAFDGGGDVNKAKQAYEQAAKSEGQSTGNTTVQFLANYNMGELAQREKKVEEALRYYQRALKFNPSSLETKTNIELLIQQQQEDQKNQKNEDKKDSKDKKQDQDKKDQKDKKDDKKDQGKEQSPKDKDDKKKDSDKNQDPDKQEKDKNGEDRKSEQHEKSKPQPQQFKSEELTPGDVKKIMEELDRQEQRVRAEYNKKQLKEKPRDKDW